MKGCLIFSWLLLTVVFAGCRAKSLGGADNPVSLSDDTPKNGQCVDVIFSLSNKDKWAPIVLTEILMNSQVIFHGPLSYTRAGDYLYLQTHVHRKKVVLEIRSETAEGALVKTKNVWVGDQAWIVVSRVREFDSSPDLEIVVSYEKPAF